MKRKLRNRIILRQHHVSMPLRAASATALTAHLPVPTGRLGKKAFVSYNIAFHTLVELLSNFKIRTWFTIACQVTISFS